MQLYLCRRTPHPLSDKHPMTTAPNTLYDDNAPALAALYTHVEEADLKAVRAALEAHPQWLVVPLFGLASQGTLLHLAARHGCLEIVDYLVKKELDTGVLDGSHGTPLVDAAGAGHLATVRWLLDNGAAVDGDCRGILTPLIAAAVGGHSAVAALLAQHGADLDRLHLRFNQTARDTALIWGHAALAEWLAEQGGHCAQEQMDYTRVRGSGIFEHIFERVGFVLTPCPSQRLCGQDIDLRTALVGNGRAHKLLFTLGVHLPAAHRADDRPALRLAIEPGCHHLRPALRLPRPAALACSAGTPRRRGDPRGLAGRTRG
ncbi:ankyrin repeat domain-containing protein [Metapseudomonas otitidis]|uniref:ankyrin repeat domain-containing protein n=1 Tax=Metapseudomonas otitidis TaxID=319939 RepID=UPI002810FC78|nr:ankyrin repeat domain-containing protein [Pseudomonas otitidis]WMR30593.1 ankyrin repeat domain-containing protein [Pseudomonas otitidis]